MWEGLHLTILEASTACYRESFIFTFLYISCTSLCFLRFHSSKKQIFSDTSASLQLQAIEQDISQDASCNNVETCPSRQSVICPATRHILAFYRTQRFIIMFTRAIHWPVFWHVNKVLVLPFCKTYFSVIFRPMPVLSFRLYSTFLWKLLFSPMRSTCPAHLVKLDLITFIVSGQEYKLWCSSLCSFLQSPIMSVFLGPICNMQQNIRVK
jgi:hypothetical protein